MKAKTFLDNFGYVAEAPNGIAKLRQLILQLAVTGKLVPQDPKDEPAEKLLERIALAKQAAKLRSVGNGDGEKEVDVTIAFANLPEKWVHCRLEQICKLITDGTHHTPRYTKSGVPFISVKDISSGTIDLTNTKYISEDQHKDLAKRCHPEYLDVLLTKVGTTGIAKVVDIKIPFSLFVSVALLKIVPNTVNPFYIELVINSPYVKAQSAKFTMGVGNKNLVLKYIKAFDIPLPPLHEQTRILARVDELMKLCDELQEQKKRKAETRAAVSKAALSELTTVTEPKLFSKSWQRISDHFNIIFDTPETVKDLRQAILQLAVTGKLVPQDPKDEPAEKLIERMTLNPQYNGKAITANKTDLDLPSTWSMAAMGQITSKVHYGFTASANANMKAVRLLRITDIQNGKVNWDTVPGCSIEQEKVSDYKLSCRDILIARTGGTVGKSFLIESAPVTAVFASYLIRLVPFNDISEYYLRYYLDSPLYWQQLYASCLGTGQPNVNGTALRQLAVPLPPLPEQHRIVAKVDELMKLCDELETQLRHSQSSADQLFDAVVAGMMKQ